MERSGTATGSLSLTHRRALVPGIVSGNEYGKRPGEEAQERRVTLKCTKKTAAPALYPNGQSADLGVRRSERSQAFSSRRICKTIQKVYLSERDVSNIGCPYYII
jgi:hypothetical protein